MWDRLAASHGLHEDWMPEQLPAGLNSYNNMEIIRMLEQSMPNARQIRDDFIRDLRVSNNELRRRISDLDTLIRQLDANLDAHTVSDVNTALLFEQSRLDMLVSIREMQMENRLEMDRTEKEIINLSQRIDQSAADARAAHEAYVEAYLTAAGREAEWSSLGNALSVFMMLSPAEAENVAIGQDAYVRFDELPFRDYGEARGTVTNIITEFFAGQNLSLFAAEIALYDSYLENRRGEIAYITEGMMGEVRISG
jgi:hypothetical protein